MVSNGFPNGAVMIVEVIRFKNEKVNDIFIADRIDERYYQNKDKKRSHRLVEKQPNKNNNTIYL